MIGIYKITSPTKKIYIGQSTDIEKRWKSYMSLKCKNQVKLYNSLLKYGVENHKFEVLCQCQVDELNEMERFYQDAFCVMNDKGLNCILTKSNNRSGELPCEIKEKISKSRKGFIVSKETRDKISKSSRGRKHTIETIEKMSIAQSKRTPESRAKIYESTRGKKRSEDVRYKMKMAQQNISNETREKHRKNKLGKKASIETRLKMSKSQKNSMTIERRLKMSKNSANRKIVICVKTGIEFDSAKQAAISIGYNEQTLRSMLNGSRINKTNFIYA